MPAPSTWGRAGGANFTPGQKDVGPFVLALAHVTLPSLRDVETWRRGDVETWRRGDVETWRQGDVETWRRGDTDTVRYGYDTIRHGIRYNTNTEAIRIRYEYDTIAARYDTIR